MHGAKALSRDVPTSFARICFAGLVVVVGSPLLSQQAPNPGGSKHPPNAVFVPFKNAQSPDVLTGKSGSLVAHRATSTAVSETQRVLLETLVKEVTALTARVAALEAAAQENAKIQPPPAPQKP